MSEPQHSILSPSSMGRWKADACPGSPREIVLAGLPDKPSKYSAEGTLAHTIGEFRLSSALNGTGRYLDMRYPVGSKHEVDGFTITVTTEMLDAVQVYVDYVLDVMQTYKLKPCHVRLEQKVIMPGVDYDGRQRFGKADCVIEIPYRRLIVVDYKHGAGVGVDVEDNPQAQSYGVATLDAMPDYIRDELPEVELVIVQPRRPTGNPISSWTISREQIEAFRSYMLESLEAAKQPDAPVVAGDWCHKYFCPLRPTCPAASAFASRSAGLRAEDDFRHVVAAQVQRQLPAPANLTNEKLADLLNGRDYVEKWFKAIADEAHARLDAGQEIPGFHLEDKLGNRQWKEDAEPELRKVALEKGVNIYTKPELLSPAQAEKALKGVDLSPYTVRPKTGKSVKKGSGKPTAEDDFKGVTIDV